MADNDVTAALAEIRGRSERPLPGVSALPISNDAVRYLMESAGDVPRLLVAVEEIVSDHTPVAPTGPHEGVRYCAYDGFVYPCPTVRIVRAALLKQEADADA